MSVINDASTIAAHKGRYMVGSIHKTTSAISFSANPITHSTIGAAKTEALRLANLDPTKKFIIVVIDSIVSKQDVVWE